jgi:hypothetical protein
MNIRPHIYYRWILSLAAVVIGYAALAGSFRWVHNTMLSGVPDGGPITLAVYPVFAVSYSSMSVWGDIGFFLLFTYSLIVPLGLGVAMFLLIGRPVASFFAVGLASGIVVCGTAMYPSSGDNRYVDLLAGRMLFVALMFVGVVMAWWLAYLRATGAHWLLGK